MERAKDEIYNPKAIGLWKLKRAYQIHEKYPCIHVFNKDISMNKPSANGINSFTSQSAQTFSILQNRPNPYLTELYKRKIPCKSEMGHVFWFDTDFSEYL